MNCFISGISGFAGIHLTSELIKNNCCVSGIYFPAETKKNFLKVHPEINIELCDILNKDELCKIIREYNPDIVFHLAGIASVKFASINIQKTIDTNIKGLVNLLDACVQLNKKPVIIFISSAEVYDFRFCSKPLDEGVAIKPVSPYSITKHTGEMLFEYYIKSEKINGVIARPFNHIGPGQSPDFSISSFAKKIAEIEKYKKTNIIKTGNLNAERDFTDVRDVVAAYYKISRLPIQPEKVEIFNIASSKPYKIRYLLDKLISFSTEKNITIEEDKSLYRKIDILKTVGDYSKLNQATGWQPLIDIESTLLSVLNYWRENV